MTQVFVLNMAYDVPVKLFSFHMILFCLFLLAPEASRLCGFFFSHQPVPQRKATPLFRSPRASRFAVFAQFAFMGYLVVANLHSAKKGWMMYGGGAPKSVLYGIWEVDEFSVDGQIHAPLLSDSLRWHRIIFDFPQYVWCQLMDDSVHIFTAALDAKENSLVLTKGDAKEPQAKFKFQRSAPDQLLLDGMMGGQNVHARLHLLDRNKFLLVNRGFHWVQEYPFNH